MDKMQLKSETLPTRCEICHKSDCFDAQNNFCSRCAGVPTTVPSRFNNSADFLDAVNDARFIKTFGIISLVGAIFFGLGKPIGIGVGLAVLWYSKNNYYRMLGTFVAALSVVITPLFSFWVLSTAVIVKGYEILKVLRQHGKDDPDWQITRKRVLTGIITSAISFLISFSIVGIIISKEIFLKSFYDSLKEPIPYAYEYKKSDKSILIQATIRGDKPKVSDILINELQDIDAKDNSGTTALIYAAQLGNKEILILLCEAGANTNIQDVNGQSALMYGAMNGHTDIVQTLLRWGAKAELKNNIGYTALDYAKQKNQYVIEELLREPPKTN